MLCKESYTDDDIGLCGLRLPKQQRWQFGAHGGGSLGGFVMCSGGVCIQLIIKTVLVLFHSNIMWHNSSTIYCAVGWNNGARG